MYIDVKIKKQVSAWAEPGPTSKHKNPVSHLLTPQLRAPWPGRVRGAAWHRARGSGRRDMSYGGSLHRPRRHTHRPNYSQFFGVKNIFYHKIFLRYSLDVFCFLNITGEVFLYLSVSKKNFPRSSKVTLPKLRNILAHWLDNFKASEE